ncbi:DUF4214 domain-containing protein [Actinotalea sp.]|uniref:DUF4214 domain-containing protein n=1 Tax=Actinotalea sp. TaxID=1872145 RepID=UPI0035680A79
MIGFIVSRGVVVLRRISSLIVSVVLVLVGVIVAPQAAVASTSQVKAYVNQVYNDLFERDADAAGLAYWTGALQAGTPYGDVANGITYSAEYRTRMIRDAYLTYLDRAPEAAGLAGWLGAMQSGMHIEQMQGGFISSPEYYALGGGTDTGWVTRLYQKVLHRSPAPSEVAYWLGRLSAGATRYEVATGFLYSTEHLTEVVDGYYRLLLHRSIDPAGRQTWVTKIQTGSRDEQIIASIVSSAEYRGNVVAPVDPTDPGNPGNSKDCSDFATWAEAQSWYETYYPLYGDVAKLDSDGDRIACEGLLGAP